MKKVEKDVSRQRAVVVIVLLSLCSLTLMTMWFASSSSSSSSSQSILYPQLLYSSLSQIQQETSQTRDLRGKYSHRYGYSVPAAKCSAPINVSDLAAYSSSSSSQPSQTESEVNGLNGASVSDSGRMRHTAIHSMCLASSGGSAVGVHFDRQSSAPLLFLRQSSVNHGHFGSRQSVSGQDFSSLCFGVRPSSVSCNGNGVCFFGDCFCKPGYNGTFCEEKLDVANPWYSRLCPNLNMTNTLDVTLPLQDVGGEYDSRREPNSADPKFCAYLCYSHASYGTAAVPVSLWRAAQQAEGDLWKQVGRWHSSAIGSANDRAQEHWKAYDNFGCLARDGQLGDVLEVGAGPWTQLKGLLHTRPDIRVSSFVVWEPSADRYMSEVSTCAYKSGKGLMRWDGTGLHPFPVTVQSKGGELLSSLNRTYDTVITMNVLEHVQDAFQYLTGVYHALRRGGVLIMHERYYNDSTIMDGDNYHPIRIKRLILDKFLDSGFHVVFNNCSAAYEGRANDQGYYVIALKI